MAEASSSLQKFISQGEESSISDYDRQRRSTPSSKRRNHYGSQRVIRSSRSATGASTGTGRTGDKRVSYEEPAAFDNLDEQAISPPIENPDDEPTYRRRSALEDTIGASHSHSKEPTEAKDTTQHKSARKRRSHGAQDLAEVAAPPPTQKSLDEEGRADLGHQHYLEDAEDEREPSDGSLPFQRRSPNEFVSENAEPEVPRYFTELYTVSYLIFFSIIGTLARLGTQWITFYPGTPVVTPVIWANFGGSVVMGFLAEDQGLFRNSYRAPGANGESIEMQRSKSKVGGDLDGLAKTEGFKRKKTIPLYIGLATGFCGSFTSFSSFARDLFLAVSNDLPTPINHPHPGTSIPHPSSTVNRDGGYSFEAFLHVVITTLALSLGGLLLGAQVAIFLDPLTPRIHGSFIRKLVDPFMVFLAFGSWLGAVLLAIWPPDRHVRPTSTETWRGEVIFALVFAPLGCLLRFYASMKLNGLVPSFPLGTFAVNMLGTAVEGMCYDIQHIGVGKTGYVGGGVIACQVLQGVQDGFCGCLTTVSTWVAEINGLKRKHGWPYAFGSILGGLCLLLVIMGSVRWSVGYSNPVCNTGYTSKVHG